MLITEATIQKFFDHKCTKGEAEAVAAYLQANPELLDRYFEDEWKNGATEELSEEESALLLQHVRMQAEINTPVRWMRKTIAVAASLLIVFCMGWLLRSQKQPLQLAKAKPAVPADKQWQVRSNLTAKAMNLVLEDASVLKLQPASVIKYISFAGETKRDVCLSGESFFKVAKDKTKPFTVFAGGVATTAVGTEFSVAEKNGRVTVKLFEGKVRIQATTHLPGWKKKELYLSPGEEFIYDKNAALFEVRAILKEHKPVAEKVYVKGEESITPPPVITTANWYMFNNQSLSNVFGQLEEIYNVKITYDPGDVKNVYFIGRFEKTDSLVDILRNIALLKKLNIRHTDNRYVITRKK